MSANVDQAIQTLFNVELLDLFLELLDGGLQLSLVCLRNLEEY